MKTSYKKTLNLKRLALTSLGVFTTLLLVMFGASVFFGKYTLTFQLPVVFRPLILIKENQTINPLVEVVVAQSRETAPELQPTNPIEQEILDVFGQEAYPKAMLLLKGKKGGCSENKGLDPEAVNVNKDGSKDYGVFQLNSNWHGFNKAVNNERY